MYSCFWLRSLFDREWFFFFSSRRRHTRCGRDWSSDVCSSDLSRFRCDGDPVFHYMGCSTFANYTVLPEIALAKVRDGAPFDKICYIGCGVTTGVGAVINTAKVWPGANIAVFSLGG